MSIWLIIGIVVSIIAFSSCFKDINTMKNANNNLHNYRMENDEEYRKYVEYVQKNDPDSFVHPNVDLHTNNSSENKD